MSEHKKSASDKLKEAIEQPLPDAIEDLSNYLEEIKARKEGRVFIPKRSSAQTRNTGASKTESETSSKTARDIAAPKLGATRLTHRERRRRYKFRFLCLGALVIIIVLMAVLPMVMHVFLPGKGPKLPDGASILVGGIVLACLLGAISKQFIFLCDHCKYFIAHTLPWECRCGHVNAGEKGNSFWYGCWQCKELPNAIHCPRCREFIVLDNSHDTDPNVGKFLNAAANEVSPSPQQTGQSPSSVENERKQQLRDLDFQTELEQRLTKQLRAKLERMEAEERISTREEGKRVAPKSELERQRDKLKRESQRLFAVDEACEEEIREGDEKYKDNPVLRKKNSMFVAVWRESQIRE